MPTETDRILGAIQALGLSLSERMGGLEERQSKMEITLQATQLQQAEDKGRDVNPRLHDHEMRMRKLEQFKFWLLGGSVAVCMLVEHLEKIFFK